MSGHTPGPPVNMKDAIALCAELPLIRHRLFKAGLFRTGHAIESAVQAVGYETADALAKAQPHKAGDHG